MADYVNPEVGPDPLIIEEEEVVDPADIMDVEEQAPQAIPAQPAFQFSLTPARAVTGVIDFETERGRKLYSAATAKLQEELFNCENSELFVFRKALKDRAMENGWNNPVESIMSIPMDVDDANTRYVDLIDNHGEISLETIRASEETYIHTKTQAAQDSHMLYRCLMASLSQEGKKKVLVWSHQYTIGSIGSGNLLLKVIMRESHLDTNATTSTIRTSLTQLDGYVKKNGYNIVKFNSYVKLMIDGLRARGETTQDLLINLFKGYLACPNQEFVSYVRSH